MLPSLICWLEFLKTGGIHQVYVKGVLYFESSLFVRKQKAEHGMSAATVPSDQLQSVVEPVSKSYISLQCP